MAGDKTFPELDQGDALDVLAATIDKLCFVTGATSTEDAMLYEGAVGGLHCILGDVINDLRNVRETLDSDWRPANG